MTFFSAFALDVTEVGETVELACRYFRQLGLAEFDARQLEIARRFHVWLLLIRKPDEVADVLLGSEPIGVWIMLVCDLDHLTTEWPP